MTQNDSPVLTSTGEAIPFTPSYLEGTKDAPIFYLRAGDVIERGALEAKLSAPPYLAGRVYSFELRSAIRDGVRELLAGDPGQEEVLALIALEEDGVEEVTLTAKDKALLGQVREILAKCWPPYVDLLGQLERRRELAPLLAFRQFCVGIEKKGVTFSLDRFGQVSDATMKQIDQLDLLAAGNRAYGLLYPPTDAEKNSEGPSPSGDGQETSPSADPSAEAGSSAPTSGKKTRASRSRSGRSRS